MGSVDSVATSVTSVIRVISVEFGDVRAMATDAMVTLNLSRLERRLSLSSSQCCRHKWRRGKVGVAAVAPVAGGPLMGPQKPPRPPRPNNPPD